ncbi:uncharacterized protein N7479_003161 [Penicillium vulpinum]|uniref:F-box domain-containing protein n=1 Tax=Penicillium vulpinum TaxID=29845 RepID=A0A1V6S3Z3_9EURO|nr:uncharacterized protein N7479_003161 [Penicillium vulpinum]KAJ5963285.1 hypothetical protein N7479_003161 [Penicillium vulpinum]OQE08576.1 hypothetical protein PENVUL_c009G03012 [Penicillium vulpinum]
MFDSMKGNVPSFEESLKTILMKHLPWPRDMDQCLEPIVIKSPTPEVSGPDFLDDLPVELLLSIADFLPLEDIYCFSLCNQRLLAIFNHRTKHRDLEQKTRLSFLRRLEHDHPRYLACNGCFILHTVEGISEPFALSLPALHYPPRLDCVRASEYVSQDHLWMIIHDLSIYTHYRFHFSHLHLAMKRFYCGPQYGISTDALSFTEVTNDYVWGDRIYRPTTLFSIEAQICPKPPSLYLRIQDIMSMRSKKSLSEDKQLYEEYFFDTEQEYFATFRVCKHHSESFWMQDIAQYSDRAHLIRNCNDCNTDFEIELFADRPDGHVTILTTRWINLGPGLSLDDPRWKVNAWHGPWSEPTVSKLDSKYMASSPRDTFEALAHTSLEDLTSRNLSYLKSERYQTAMVPVPRSTPPSWALWNGATVPWNSW